MKNLLNACIAVIIALFYPLSLSSSLAVTQSSPSIIANAGSSHQNLQRPFFNSSDLPPGVQPGYLIIARHGYSNFPSVMEFSDFKRGLGFQVYFKDISEIEAEMVGVDLAEKIRAYLQLAYQPGTSPPANVRYVLLIGNGTDIPYRSIRPYELGSQNTTSTDMYYADLTGDWDSNNNGIFGEGALLAVPIDQVDYHYEVAVGRIPSSQIANINLALGKFMDFEQDGGAWKKNTLAAAAFMQFDGQSWAPKDDPLGAYDENHGKIGVDSDAAVLMEAIWDNVHEPIGLARTRLYETTLNAAGVPQSDFIADFPLNWANLRDHWNDLDYGLVNLAGHGSARKVNQYPWLPPEFITDTVIQSPTHPFDAGDGKVISHNEIPQEAFLKTGYLTNLEQPGGIAPVVAIAGCGTAGFQFNDGLGVNLVTQGKAAAYFGSLGTMGFDADWAGNTGLGVMQDVLLRFNQNLLGDYPRLGDAVWQTMMQLRDEVPAGEDPGKSLIKGVLYGDPAMSYWGDGAAYASPWPMFRHDSHNTGLTSYTGPVVPVVRWTFQLSPSVFLGAVPSPSIGEDGTIYAGNHSGVLYAINPDGTEKWHFHAGGAINAPPTITTGGTLYFRAEDGYLYSVTEQGGQQRWRIPMALAPIPPGPTPITQPFANAPRVSSDGQVYALAANDNVGWTQTMLGIFNSPGLVMNMIEENSNGAAATPALDTDNSFYYAAWNGVLYHDDPIGNGLADFALSTSLASPAVRNNGNVYIGNQDGRFYAIRPDVPAMDEIWHFDVTHATSGDIMSSAALGDDGSIYFGSRDYWVYALEANGDLRWDFNTGGPVDSSPALDATTVYVVGGAEPNAKLFAIDRINGDQQWAVTIGSNALWGSSPAIGYDHTVYVVSRDGRLFAIGPHAAMIAPNALQATPVSVNEIDLSWRDNSTAETGFGLERRKGWSGAFTPLITLGANITSYADKGLDTDQVYFYRVRALGSGISDYSNIVHSRTFTSPPSAPSGLAASPATSFSIRLSWNTPDPLAAGILIFRSTSATGPWSQVGLVTPDETEWLDINSAAAAGEPIENMLPHPGHVYYYKVRAFNERGMSSYSAGASSQTRGLTLPAPTGLRAWLTSLRSIRLTWTDKASGETGYIVERMSYEQADFEVVALLSANSQAFDDKTIESGSYLYRVRAYSAANESAPAYSNYVGGPEWIHFIYLPLVRR